MPSAAPARRALASLTAASAFVLLFAGGLVTSTGSSLAVPDWPLSFGKLMPPMVGGVLFEHGHRMIAGVVGLMVFALAAWMWRSERRVWLRRLSAALAALIVIQALLGGLTVLLRLPPAVSILHACLGQTLFCGLLILSDADSSPVPLLKESLAAFAAAYFQLILGAYLRHTGEGLILHACGALAVLHFTVVLARRAWPLLPAKILAFLLPAQIALGVLAWRIKFAPDFIAGIHREAVAVTAHVAVGAALLGTCAVLAARAWRAR